MGKVLLAEDEEDLRSLLVRNLRRAGHEVTPAEDGMVALEWLKRETFDVVVSDMKMPRLDGMGLLAQAKEIAPDTLFIILTGHGSLENAVEAFTLGNIFDYKLKPLQDIKELSTIVARAVERQELRAENARLLRELTQQAERDGLTGLYNHRTLHAQLEVCLQAVGQGPLSVILMDMDGFKQINDVYGHPFGDQALRHISRALLSICPASAVCGRYGGDEFMILLPGVATPEAAEIVESIRHYIVEHPLPTPDGGSIPLQLCFGVAEAAHVEHSPLRLVAAADGALYQGKRSGGNAVTLHMTSAQELKTPEERNPYDVLDGLVTAIDNKDGYTRLHSAHMTEFALLLVQALGSSEETYNLMRVAGLLHDVGKIGIPDSILKKPGRLTSEEYEVMQGHVTISSLIIHGIPHLSDILDAVANHHERWDGSGYPKGLAGEQIPLVGRIMAIADAFSAMTLDRPYRSAMIQEEALREIERGAGTQFDPDLARLFVQTLRLRGTQGLRQAA